MGGFTLFLVLTLASSGQVLAAASDEAPAPAPAAEISSGPTASEVTPEAATTVEASSSRARPRLLDLVRRDASQICSSRTLAILASGGLLAGAGLHFEEPNRAARMVERRFDDGADFGNAYGGIATLGSGALGLMAAGKLFHDERLSGAGGDLARALIYSAAITTPIKMAVARTRPNGGPYSFPSGHSAAAFAAAPILARHFGSRVGTLAYAAAAATMMGRIEEHKHYLSDVLVGGALGLSVGLAVSEGGGAHGFAPALTVRPSGLGLAVRF